MFTALLIGILIVTGAATVIGGGLVLAASRRKQLQGGGETKALTAGPRGFTELRPGDIVQHGAVDYLVEGVLRFEEAGHRWLGANLNDGDSSRWLYVGMERMGSTSLRFLHEQELEVSGFPPEMMTVAGVRYQLAKRGTASASRDGDVGSIPGSESLGSDSIFRCRWWRYEGAGGATLVIEQWGDEFRTLAGEELQDSDLELMPGS